MLKSTFLKICLCFAALLIADESEPDIEKLAELYLDNPVVVSSGCSIDAGSGGKVYIPHEARPHLYDPSSPDTPEFFPLVNANCSEGDDGYTVNFQDLEVIQFIKFISKISSTNYIFDSQDLQFNITIVSEESASVQDLEAMLIQVLKTNNLSVVEQGSNVLIYSGDNLSKVSTVITEDNLEDACDAAMVTRVFRLSNITAEEASKVVKPLLSEGAIVEFSGNSNNLVISDITANVTKIAELLHAIDTPDSVIAVAKYVAKSAVPTVLAEYARQILEPLRQGAPLELIPQPSSRQIYIVSTPYLINESLKVLESLDSTDVVATDLPPSVMANNNFFMYKLRYQNGKEIAAAVRSIGSNLSSTGTSNPAFISTIQSLQWLEVNNSLVVTGTEEAVAKVVDLLEELDQAPKQVYIEMLIIDTTLTNSLDFGVQWIALGDEQDKLAYASGLLANTPPAPSLQTGARNVANIPPGGSAPFIPSAANNLPLPVPGNLSGTSCLDISNQTEAFGFGIIGNILRHNGQSFLTLGALVSALDEEAETSIVLNPKIMTEDTQPASIFVGQNIPYQTTSTVIQQTGSVTQNIQYEDIGVQLDVTPTISPNNIVTLEINQTVAEVQTNIGNLTPTINKTLSTTRVHVPDNTFLVMSGYVRDEVTYIHSGVPCLGSLPLIGPAFSRTIEGRCKRNLVMFIRPRVVTNPQEGVNLTNEEGYNHNWETDPCSFIQEGPIQAPECEVYCPPCDWCDTGDPY